MNITLPCDTCGKEFPTWSAWAKKRKNHYCSKDCKNKHYKILYGNSESKSDYQKRYYLENRDKKIAQAKARWAARPGEKAAYDRLRRAVCAQRLSAERREKYILNRDQRDIRKLMLTAARARAAKKGIPCTITCEDIVIPENCPALGVKLVPNIGKLADNSPTLDRIIPDLGYVPGNVIVISARANKIKHNASCDEINKVANWLKQLVSHP